MAPRRHRARTFLPRVPFPAAAAGPPFSSTRRACAHYRRFQVRVVVDAYGLERQLRAQLVAAMLDRQTRNAQCWRDRLSDSGSSLASCEQVQERIEWSEHEHAYAE